MKSPVSFSNLADWFEACQQNRLFRGHDDFHRESIGGLREVRLQSTRITDTSFRIVDEADERPTVGPSGILSGISLDLFHEFLRAQPRTCLFHDHGRLPPIQQKRGPLRTVGVGRTPLFRADFVELQSEQSVKEILKVVFVIDL